MSPPLDASSPRLNDLHSTWIEVSRSPDKRATRDHGLVLQSLGIPHGVFEVEGGYRVVVRADHAARAREELGRYEGENKGWPPRESSPPAISQGIHAAILYIGLLIFFYIAQHTQKYELDWTALGRVDAALVRAGEWWRTITALTLHVDLPHLAGNAVFGAAFGVILAQSIGVGPAWWSFLLTGALGNAINAFAQDASHRSIGASTGVFGLLGVQIAFEWMRRAELKYRGWRRWAPVGMGVVLLGWLGTGGVSIDDSPTKITSALDRVDILAHVFGFGVGALLGLGLGLSRASLRWKPAVQVWVTLSAPFAVCVAWWFALRQR